MIVTIEVYHSDQEEIKNIMKNAGNDIYKEIIEPGTNNVETVDSFEKSIESDSLEFLFHQSFVGLYLRKDKEFKIVEEV